MPRISTTRVGTAVMPGAQSSVAELIAEYPELATQLLAYNAWRDVGQPDRRSKSFEKMFPSLRPSIRNR